MRAGLTAAVAALAARAALAAEPGERVTLSGEMIDTWCYFSGVMGPPEATLGSAHHTCAMWCAQGGIPVGLRAETGEVYMVLKIPGSERVTGGDAVLEVMSDRLTVDGVAWERDGVRYVLIDRVVENAGIAATHDEWGVVPGFAIPEPEAGK